MRHVHPGVLAIALLGSATAGPGMDTWDGRAVHGRPRLVLTFVECEPLPTDLLALVQEKTASLIESMGVDADIRTRPAGSDFDPDSVTLIVMDAPPLPRSRAGVMGAVKRKSTNRTVWMFSSNVAVGSRMRWATRHRWSARDRAAFATAMARVALHEIVHVVCPWRDHDRDGLMAEVQGASSLREAAPRLSRELRRDFVLGVNAMSGTAFDMAGDAAAPRR